MIAVAKRLQRLESAGSAAQFYSEMALACEARKPQEDVRDEDGRLCKSDSERAAAFGVHFARLLTGAGGTPCARVRAEFALRAAEAVRAPDSPPPSESQVLGAVSQQKLGRAADELGVCADLVRAAATPGSHLARMLTEIVGTVWRTRVMPRERCTAVLVAIYKMKGDGDEL